MEDLLENLDTGYLREPEIYENHYCSFVEELKGRIRRILIIRNINFDEFSTHINVPTEQLHQLLDTPDCKQCFDKDECSRNMDCINGHYDIKSYFRFLDALSYGIDYDITRID